MSVIVVTDSSAGLPPELVDGRYLRIVPLHVLSEAADYREGVDVIPGEAALTRDYTSAGAAPGELERVYSDALDGGADAVVAVHLSSALSVTVEAARRAGERLGPRVRVLDSGGAGMAMGMAVLEAVEAARSGGDADDVAAVAEAACRRAFSLVYVHTIEDLRRGGRVRNITGFMTTALSVRLLLRMGDGHLDVCEKMRIPSKGLRRLADRAVEEIADTPARLAVQHWRAPDRADELAKTLRQRLEDDTELVRSEFGPVVGMHLGPGAVGVSVLPRR